MSRRPASADPLWSRPPASPPISVSAMIHNINTNTITTPNTTEIEVSVLSSASPTPPSSPIQGLSARILEDIIVSSDDSKPLTDNNTRAKRSTIFDDNPHDDSGSNDIELYSGKNSPQATSTQSKPPNHPGLTPEQIDRMTSNRSEALRRKKGGIRDWNLQDNRPRSPASDVSEHLSLPSPPTSAAQFNDDAVYNEIINNQPSFREAPNDIDMTEASILSKRKRDLLSNPSSIESTLRKKDIEKDKKAKLNRGLIAEGANAMKTNVKDAFEASSNAVRRKLASNDEARRPVPTISAGVSKVKRRNF